MAGFNNRYIPSQDQALAAWALNFSSLITAAPSGYGLTAGQASTFAALRIAYIAALSAATNPSTRTTSTVALKNSSKALMVANARVLAAIVQGTPSVTNQQRQDLGLTVRDRIPGRINAPTTFPILTVTANEPLNTRFRFADQNTPASRSKPFGVTQLQLYFKTGDVAPTSIADCQLAGNYTVNSSGPGSRDCALAWSGADAGKRVHFIGVWSNRRGEQGPESAVVATDIVR